MTQKLVVPITFNIYQGDELVRTETIAQNVIKIGRDQKSQLRIDDDSVSRMHAVIEAKPGEVQVIDLGSGTSVNGQAVNKASLADGDELRIGTVRIVLNIGEPIEAASPAPVTSPVTAPAVAQAALTPPTMPVASFAPAAGAAAPSAAVPAASTGFAGDAPVATPAVGHDEQAIYQLIKRGDINPIDVEEVGQHAVEVSILWKNVILHVAHLDGASDFVLASERAKNAPAKEAFIGGVAAGTAAMAAGAAMGNYTVGAVGTVLALAGAGAGIALDSRNATRKNDVSRFVVGTEVIQNASVVPVVLNHGGSTRLVIPSGATGDAEIDGVKRSLKDLIANGTARASSALPGAHELDVKPGGRYRLDAGALTIVAKVVAPGRRIANASRLDGAMLGALAGAAFLIVGSIIGMRFAIGDDGSYLSSSNDEDRLNDLRAFIQRQQERQPEQVQQQNDDQQEGGTGTRHAGAEGKMGKRDAPAKNARYAIRNNGEPPHLSRQQARDVVNRTGVLAAIGAAGGMAGGSSGIVSPFGSMSESGVDNQNANGNMNGAEVGDAFGYGGLGAAGTGWGGGGTGEGTIGLGGIGTMGHGSGTGSGQGYGSGAGRGLRNRGNTGPMVRAQPPQVAGLLSPEAIRRVVLRNLGQVSHCHEQGLAQNPNLEGRVVIRFVIGGTGTVMSSNVGESSVPSPSVAQCIASAVRRWQFPSPEGGGIVTVNYPFTLSHPE